MSLILDNLDFIANIIEVATLLFAILAWIQSSRLNRRVREERMKMNKEVKIKLVNGDKSYIVPVPLKGSEVSRAEILGRLGMIPIKPEKAINVKSPRFSISYLSTDAFMNRLNEIDEITSDTTVEISCTDEEFQQFKFAEV
jgi:hypothetical protein